MQPMSVAKVSPLATQEMRSQTGGKFREQDLFDEIERQVGSRNFEHWFRGKTSLRFSNEEILIGVGTPFLLTWMQKYFRGPIATAVANIHGTDAQVRFHVDSTISLKAERSSQGTTSKASSPGDPDDRKAASSGGSNSGGSTPPLTDAHSPQAGSAVAAERKTVDRSMHLQEQTSSIGGRRFADLSDFVIGPCNELALMASRQVGDTPGARFNPLYLHGNPGTGKTHLLEGIYRTIRRKHPMMQVLYLTAESFANHFTQALREHKLPGFRQRFRGVDVLLIDDIDFLDGKRAIQEEFLHTFQHLISHGRQVAVSADRHPRLLSKLSEELTSRFVSGLICKLEAPDFETRLKIVERKTVGKSAAIAPEALQYVAQKCRNNVRELEGALNGLETYHVLTRQRITLTVTQKVLANLELDSTRTVRIPDIEQTICKFFGVEPRDIRGSRRLRTLSQPRMLAMYLIRKHTHAAYSEIGEHFGGRNHSTVIAAEKRVREMLGSGEAIRIASRTWPLDQLIDAIEQQLQAG